MTVNRVLCSKCGKDEVAVYMTPETALCQDCCATALHEDGEEGHQYEYERGEGHMCRYCGARPPSDWFGDEL